MVSATAKAAAQAREEVKARRYESEREQAQRAKLKEWAALSTGKAPRLSKRTLTLREAAATGDERSRLQHAIGSRGVVVRLPRPGEPDLVVVEVTDDLTLHCRPADQRWNDHPYPDRPWEVRSAHPWWFTAVVEAGTARTRLWASLLAQAGLRRHPFFAAAAAEAAADGGETEGA